MDSRPHGHMLRIAWVGYCAEKCGCDEKLDCNSKNFHLHTISFIVVFFSLALVDLEILWYCVFVPGTRQDFLALLIKQILIFGIALNKGTLLA